MGSMNDSKEIRESCRKDYEFWVRKLEIALKKGDEKAIEEAHKQLDYLIKWI